MIEYRMMKHLSDILQYQHNSLKESTRIKYLFNYSHFQFSDDFPFNPYVKIHITVMNKLQDHFWKW